jgi:hypothetical protein
MKLRICGCDDGGRFSVCGSPSPALKALQSLVTLHNGGQQFLQPLGRTTR